MIEILTIGDELLSGRTLDENSRFIAATLHEHGFVVSRITSVGDAVTDISRALQQRLPDTRCMVVTGGLGPTEDDRTAQAAAAAFGKDLMLSADALAAMEYKYKTFGRRMPEAAKKQAILPAESSIIPNPIGTACGFCITQQGVSFLFLPGVPEEVRAMMQEFVLNHLRTLWGSPACVVNKTLKVFGLWESEIHERLAGHLPDSSIVAVGYYPQYPEISIKISGRGTDAALVHPEVACFENIIFQRIGEYVYATSGESLEEVVGTLLIKNRATLAVAESCTGGLIMHRLTNVPGSSAYLERGFIVYSNRAKQELLSVPEEIIREHGAVSEQVARSMALGAKKHAGTTYGLAVTGIAGPSGGSVEKPVGTVYIGIATDNRCDVRHYHFSGTREKIKTMTAQVALNLLRQFILAA